MHFYCHKNDFIKINYYCYKIHFFARNNVENCLKIAAESMVFIKTVQALNRQPEMYAAFCDASKAPYR
jgi:hypothetical protein